MDRVKDGWFMEKNVLWPGQATSFEIDEILLNERSSFQDILVFKSKTYGNVLVLDGIIQITERDEISYQEMIAHLPLFSHQNPEKVLVIGGGDGGVIREVLKHPCVKEVTLCEIDETVIKVSQKYFPKIAASFKDERVTIKISDGARFVKEHPETFDVIIVDSSDPPGPAETLFEDPFYHAMHRSLRPKGISCAQGESVWLNMDLITKLLATSRRIFSAVEYAYTNVPSYPCGQIGFVLCGKDRDGTTLRKPSREPSAAQQASLHFYNPDMHKAAFILPEFARRELESQR